MKGVIKRVLKIRNCVFKTDFLALRQNLPVENRKINPLRRRGMTLRTFK